MMKKHLKKILFLCCLSTGSLFAADFGTVNFANCISNSKVGKHEQTTFEGLKKQLGGHLESIEKELNELSGKLNDSEYMDGLSPEAEMELRTKMSTLNDEMMRYQNQYYQVLNQSQMKIMQQIGALVSTASETVAKDQKLDVVLREEACFYFNSALDITNKVVEVMDKNYEQELKKLAAQQPAKAE